MLLQHYFFPHRLKFIKGLNIIETEENGTIIFPNKNGIKKVIIPIQNSSSSKKGL